MSKPVAYAGCCPICGWAGDFRAAREPVQAPRDFRCDGCRSTVVFQAEAAVLLDEFERGRHLCLDELVDDPEFAALAVFHLGYSGPIRNRLKRLRNYHESAFRPDLPLGAVLDGRSEFTNQDHQRLTFDDGCLDLIVSSHVLEHIPDWRAALREAFRTLKPGGRYAFSIPGRRLRAASVVRAELVDGEVVHVLEPRFHKSPEGQPALVFTDFGQDIVEVLIDIGFVASLRRPHRVIQTADVNFVVVASKPAR